LRRRPVGLGKSTRIVALAQPAMGAKSQFRRNLVLVRPQGVATVRPGQRSSPLFETVSAHRRIAPLLGAPLTDGDDPLNHGDLAGRGRRAASCYPRATQPRTGSTPRPTPSPWGRGVGPPSLPPNWISLSPRVSVAARFAPLSFSWMYSLRGTPTQPSPEDGGGLRTRRLPLPPPSSGEVRWGCRRLAASKRGRA
jgi:hypothetical protein